MAEWITKAPDVSGATPTVVPAPMADGQKEAFWVSNMAAASDPFFEVTSGLESVRTKAAEPRRLQAG